jgi:hypothetical protein
VCLHGAAVEVVVRVSLHGAAVEVVVRVSLHGAAVEVVVRAIAIVTLVTGEEGAMPQAKGLATPRPVSE